MLALLLSAVTRVQSANSEVITSPDVHNLPAPPPPIITIKSPINDAVYHDMVPLTVTIEPKSLNVDNGAMSWVLASLTCSVDGQSEVRIVGDVDVTLNRFNGNANLTGLSEGSHQIVIHGTRLYLFLGLGWAFSGYPPTNSFVSAPVSFTVDYPPTVSILSIENKTYNTTDIPLNFRVNEPTSWIGYNIDGNATVRVLGNTTLTELPYGLHNITVCATDLHGNTGASETINFTIAQPQETKPKAQSEPFPTTLGIAAAVLVSVAVVGAGLIIYFKKRKR